MCISCKLLSFSIMNMTSWGEKHKYRFKKITNTPIS